MNVSDPPSTAFDDLQAKFDKLKRRQKRNERAAWAKGFLSAVCGMLKPGDLAIDLGANVGEVSARLLASGADVIAFDPEPWAVEQLQKRFEGQDQFTLHNAAVGVEDGTIPMFRAANFAENEHGASVKSTVVQGGRMINYEADEVVHVQQSNFINFLKDLEKDGREVAFLKMDIEGAELDLLRAMDQANLFDNIRCCVVETHENKFKELRADFRDLRKVFGEKYSPDHVNLDWI